MMENKRQSIERHLILGDSLKLLDLTLSRVLPTTNLLNYESINSLYCLTKYELDFLLLVLNAFQWTLHRDLCRGPEKNGYVDFMFPLILISDCVKMLAFWFYTLVYLACLM